MSATIESLEKMPPSATSSLISKMPSELNKGGKEEEVKLVDMFLARCQKSRGELD